MIHNILYFIDSHCSALIILKNWLFHNTWLLYIIRRGIHYLMCTLQRTGLKYRYESSVVWNKVCICANATFDSMHWIVFHACMGFRKNVLWYSNKIRYKQQNNISSYPPYENILLLFWKSFTCWIVHPYELDGLGSDNIRNTNMQYRHKNYKKN